jgi:AraC family transcriptional regulator, transcriptional activator FtrA
MPDRGLAHPWYDFVICGQDDAEVGGWLKAGLSRGLDALADADIVVVPSCRDVAEPPPQALADAVRVAHRRGARVASLCTGAFVLAEAGLLDGRRATTHWAHTTVLQDRYPAVRVDANVLYIDEGDVLTSAGKAAALDLCLHLVRTGHGTAVANALARSLVVPPHRQGGQAQFIPAAVAHGRDNVLADRRAQELLETSDLSVEQIASRTGMGTATTLRRHFSHQLGVPPETYRRTFRS